MKIRMKLWKKLCNNNKNISNKITKINYNNNNNMIWKIVFKLKKVVFQLKKVVFAVLNQFKINKKIINNNNN